MNARNNQPAVVDDHTQVEVLPPELAGNLAAVQTASELQTLVAVARRYPRSLELVKQNIASLVTLDEETAKECMYAVPRDKGKAIEGASIRFAEIVASQWGNCTVEAIPLHLDRDEKVVIAIGQFLDLETNTRTRVGVRRRVSSKGKIYSDDMIAVTFSAAVSIGRRNAILAGVPKPVWRSALDAARRVVMGDIKTLTNRRAGALEEFKRFGVVPEQIYKKLEVEGENDITLEHMPELIGMFQALKSGAETVESMFVDGFEKVSNPLKDDEEGPKPATAKPNEVADEKTGEVTTVVEKPADEAKGADKAAPATAEKPAEKPAEAADPKPGAKAKAAEKPAEAAKDGEPKTGEQYLNFLEVWLPTMTDAEAVSARWSAERKMRNNLQTILDGEQLAEANAMVAARRAALKG